MFNSFTDLFGRKWTTPSTNWVFGNSGGGFCESRSAAGLPKKAGPPSLLTTVEREVDGAGNSTALHSDKENAGGLWIEGILDFWKGGLLLSVHWLYFGEFAYAWGADRRLSCFWLPSDGGQ